MLKIGLTGGIGSGKSTVAHYFSDYGVPVIDTDQLARELVLPGSPTLQLIVDTLGGWVLDEQGGLDREALRDRVFREPAMRKELEGILHPAIAAELLQRLSRLQSPYCVIVIPLLLESGWQRYVDQILVVDLPEKLQIERATRRDNSDKGSIARIMASQCDRAERLAAADDVIDNSHGADTLPSQVERLHDKYLELAAHRK